MKFAVEIILFFVACGFIGEITAKILPKGWDFHHEHGGENDKFDKIVEDPVGFLHRQQNRKVIIDTDGGADDAAALLMGLTNSDWDILAITTTVGNTNLKQVVINTLKTLRVVHSREPIYPGSNESILVTPPPQNYFGLDGFGDVPYPNPPSLKEAQREHAVATLIRLVNQHPKQVTIIATGPLTNIAMAIRLDPEFKKNVKMIYWMGGSVQGLGNVKPGLEFNAYMDPAACFITLDKAGPPIVMVSWELTQLVAKVSMNWRLNVLGKKQTAQMKFLNAIEEKVLAKETSGFWNSADTKCMAIAMNPGIVKKASVYHIEPSWEGEFTKGVTIVDYTKISGKALNAIIIEDIDVDEYKKMVLRQLGTSV